MNVASLAPITAVQVSCSQIFRSLLFNNRDDYVAKATSAFSAGAVSGLISGPSECIIVNQQATGMGVGGTFSSIYKAAGLSGIIRGSIFAMLRDASFTAGYVALAPIAAEALYNEMTKTNPNTSLVACRILSGIAVGCVVGVASHPFDTWKTVLQRDYDCKKYRTTLDVIKSTKPFNGLVPRLTRVAIGVCVLSTVTSLVSDYIIARDPPRK